MKRSFLDIPRLTEENDDDIASLCEQRLMVTPGISPIDFMSPLMNAANEDPIKMRIAHGTTTLAFKYHDGEKDGILIAVDSRATVGGYIASQSVKKVIEVNDRLLATMAGGAADCSYWGRFISKEAALYKLKYKDDMTVAAISKVLVNIIHKYKGTGLSMGMMIAGFDKTGPNLYYVDSDGSRLKNDLFSVGSGSTYAYGVLDTVASYRFSKNEAIELGKRAIYQATFRDAYSGGQVNIYHMDINGWECIGGYDVGQLHYEYTKKI